MNRKFASLISAAAFAFLVAGCGNDSSQSSSSAPPAEQSSAAQTAQAPAPAPQTVITGKVIETMDASGYTYIHLDQGSDQIWVAAPAATLNEGDEVGLIYSMSMENFESKALGKTFDKIIFASGFAPDSGAAGMAEGQGSFSEALQDQGGMQQATNGGSEKARVPFTDLNIEKAEGDNAVTVGELFEKKESLSGTPILLRGKVMKVSKNIMGTNWIHLQDGTGNPMDNTHDLVVTSATVPELDAVVTVKGDVTTDKDFGAGYKYSVIIEEAEIE